MLTAIGRNGPDAFYRGDVAQAIVSDVRANGGILSEEDLAQYKPFVWEGGLEVDYRGLTVRVPPFACAGSTSAMTLNLFAGFDAAASGHNSADTLHAYISSARLAYADRFEYFGDPAFVDTPWKGLLSDAYADRRRAEIGDRALAAYKPGDPWREEGRAPKEKLPSSLPAFDTGTTHLCAMDKDGNAVSLTNTLMAGFGSGIVAKGTGVVMNDGMMWFDPLPGRVNSIMPGKFPLNNMTPALVLDGSGVRLAVGASGGRRITNCVTQLISKVMDFGLGRRRPSTRRAWTAACPRPASTPGWTRRSSPRSRRGPQGLHLRRRVHGVRLLQLRQPLRHHSQRRRRLPRRRGHVPLRLRGRPGVGRKSISDGIRSRHR